MACLWCPAVDPECNGSWLEERLVAAAKAVSGARYSGLGRLRGLTHFTFFKRAAACESSSLQEVGSAPVAR